MSRFRRFPAGIRIGLVAAGLIACATPFTSAQAGPYTPQELANMKLVTGFFAALDRGAARHDLRQEISGIADQYLSPDYTDHDAMASTYGAGREGFVRMFQNAPTAPGGSADVAPSPPKVVALMAHGNLVIRADSSTIRGPNGNVSMRYSFDMYRIQDGKLAEHWTGSSGGGFGVPNPPNSRRQGG